MHFPTLRAISFPYCFQPHNKVAKKNLLPVFQEGFLEK